MRDVTNGNPIQHWLDQVGIPWRESREALAARYGISKTNPYRWDMVTFKLQPQPLDNLLIPFGFQEFGRFAPYVPPVRFSAHLYTGPDATANIEDAARQFARHFGPRAIKQKYNILEASWTSGLAVVNLTAWDPGHEFNASLRNDAHAREPRLKTACLIEILSGWRVPLAPYEKHWLKNCTPLDAVCNWPRTYDTGISYKQRHMVEGALEYIRIAPADITMPPGHFGTSDDGSVLIVNDDLLHIVPVEQILYIEVHRLVPAKGGGRSGMSVVCNNGHPGQPDKHISLAQGMGADDLNAVAERLAYKIGKPLHLLPYQPDA